MKVSYQSVEKWMSDQLLNASRSEAPLAFKTWITVLASENISLSQFVARQRFGRTGRERGCAASAVCPVGLTSIFQRAASRPQDARNGRGVIAKSRTGVVLVTGSFSFAPTPRHRLLYAAVRIFAISRPGQWSSNSRFTNLPHVQGVSITFSWC